MNNLLNSKTILLERSFTIFSVTFVDKKRIVSKIRAFPCQQIL